MTTLFTRAPPELAHRTRRSDKETTFAVVYHHGVQRGLTPIFLSHVSDLGLEIVVQRMVHPDHDNATDFLLSADPHATWNAAKKIRERYQRSGRSILEDFGTEELQKISAVLYGRIIAGLRAGPMIAFEIRGTNAVERVRHLVEAPKGSGAWCVRHHFYPDCFDTANAAGREFEKNAHAAKDELEVVGGRAWLDRQDEAQQLVAA